MTYQNREFYIVYLDGELYRPALTESDAWYIVDTESVSGEDARWEVKKARTVFPKTKSKKKAIVRPSKIWYGLRKIDMIALRFSGMSLKDIGARYDVGKERVRQIIGNTGRAMVKYKLDKEGGIESLGGLTSAQVSRKTGIAIATIRQHRIEKNLCYTKGVHQETYDTLVDIRSTLRQRLMDECGISSVDDDCSSRHVITESGLRIAMTTGVKVNTGWKNKEAWRFYFRPVLPADYVVCFEEDGGKMFVIPEKFFDKYAPGTHIFQISWPQDKYQDNPSMPVYWCENWTPLKEAEQGEKWNRVLSGVS